MSDPYENLEPAADDLELPEFDDEYLDEVVGRLVFNFDLDGDVAAAGERFDLHGEMRMESKKHFFHPSLSFAHHGATEHLFVRRVDGVSVADLERLVELGHELADDWVEPDEEHYGTDFTFALVAPRIPADVREFVAGFHDRTLLKFGYYGHYEVNLLVVAPGETDHVASENADVARAFTTWETIEDEEPGLLGLIARRLQI